MSITLIIIGFLVVFLLAYSGSLPRDVQMLKRFLRSLFVAGFVVLPAATQAQYWGKFEPVCSIKAHDPDTLAKEVYFTIAAGNSDKTFVITPCTGQLQADTSVYKTFTRSKTYYLTCRAVCGEKA